MAFGNKYASYTSDFRWKNPFYDEGSFSVSSETIDLMSNAYKRRYAFDPYEERTGLNRAFDALLLPNYAVAGFVKGLVDNGQEKDISPWQGAWRGIKAGNPFGDGFNQGRTSFSDVLETAGWKPTNTFGKIAKGVAGFVLDVAFDPTTYLSGGASAIVKGTGRAGLKAFERESINKLVKDYGITHIDNVDNIADLPTKIRESSLADSAVKGLDSHQSNFIANLAYDDAMTKIAPTLGGMSEDMAREAIKLRQFKRGATITEEQLTKDSQALAKRYNKMIGLQDSSRFNMKLSNAPFGDKLFGWTGIADKSLFDINTMGLAKLSDKLKVSSAYSTMRKNIYGTQFGRLFSNNAKLYQLSKADPGTLYDYISAMDKFHGLKLDKLELQKQVEAEAKKLELDLDPADLKTVIKLMEDKKAWKFITMKLKFGRTREGKEIKHRIAEKEKVYHQEVADLKQMRDDLEALSFDETHLNAIKENDQLTAKANLEALNEVKNKGMRELETNLIKRLSSLKTWLHNERDLMVASRDSLLKDIEELDTFVKAPKNISEKGRLEIDNLISDYMDTRGTYDEYMYKKNNLSAQLKPKPHTSITLTGRQLAENREVAKLNAPIRKMIKELEEKEGVTFLPQKDALTHALGDFFFDDASSITRSAPDDEIVKIIEMLQQGRTYDEIRRHMHKIEDTLSGKREEVNKFIAQNIGYGKDGAKHDGKPLFAGWEDYYTARINPILEKETKRASALERYDRILARLEKRKKQVVPKKNFDPLDENAVKQREEAIKDNQKVNALITNVKRRMNRDPDMIPLTAGERILKKKLLADNNKRQLMRIEFKVAQTPQEVQEVKMKYLDQQMMDEFVENPEKFHSPHSVSKSDIDKWRDTQLDNDRAKSGRTVDASKKGGKKETYGDGVTRSDVRQIDDWDKTVKNEYDDVEWSMDEFTPELKDEIYQDILQELRYANYKGKQVSIVTEDINSSAFVVGKGVFSKKNTEKYRQMIELMPDLLKNVFKRNYSSLSQRQKIFLFDLAEQSLRRVLSKEERIKYIGDEGKRIADALKLRKLDELIKGVEDNVKVGYDVSFVHKKVIKPAVQKKDAVYIDDFKPARIRSVSNDPETKRRIFELELIDDKGVSTGRVIQADGRDLKGAGGDTPGVKVHWNEKKLKEPAQDEVKAVVEENMIDGRISEITKDEHGGTIYTVSDNNGNTLTIRPHELVEGEIRKKKIEEIVMNEKVIDEKAYEEFALRREELVKLFEYRGERFRGVKKEIAEKERLILEEYEHRKENLGQAMKDLEDTYKELTAKIYDDLDPNLPKKILDNEKATDELVSKIESMQKVLSDDDALEAYVRGNPNFGDQYVDGILNSVSVAYLDANKQYNEKVIEATKFLKEKFAEIAMKEVEIGKLKQVQVDKMVDRYVPHITTATGDDFFKVWRFAEDANGDLIAVEKTLEHDEAFLTQDLGYGEVWSPHGKSRTFRIKTDKLDKNGNPIWIKNPTVLQMNEYVKKFPDIVGKTKGKDIWNENIAEIYLQRGMKHLELYYDHRYMETMINNFGFVIKEFGNLEKGYKAVVNVTKIKKTIAEIASKRNKAKMSAEAIQELSIAYKDIGKRANAMMWQEIPVIGKQEVKAKYEVIRNRALQMAKDELSRVASEYLREQRKRGIKGKIDLPKIERGRFKVLYHQYREEILMTEGRPTFTVLTEDEKDKLYQKHFNGIIAREGEPELIEKSPEEIKLGFEEFYEQVMEEMKLSPRMLNEAATPMLELQNHQFDAIQGIAPDTIRAVNEAIVQRANQSRQIQIARDSYKTLKLYDKFTHWFKLNQTTVLPSFHMRNKMSNLFLNWLAVGRDAFDPKMHVASLQTVRSNGLKGSSTFKRLEKDGTQVDMTWNEAYEKAVQYDVVDKGSFAVDIGAQDATEGIMKFLPGKYDITDTKNFILYQKGAKFGNMIENGDRLLQFVSHLKMGKSFEEARDLVSKHLFDYSDITAFEATYMKRIIPFYVWMRKNARLQLSEMIAQPGKYQLMAKYSQGISGMSNQEDRLNFNFVNEFAKDWIQMPFSVVNEEGRKEPVLLNPALPYMDLSKIPNPLKPIESFRNFVSTMNPQLKIPFEQIMNKQFFFQQPIVEGKNGEKPTVGEQIKGRVDHAFSHMSLYNAGKDLVNKSGLDWGLEAFAIGTGVKALSYDYDKFKWQILKERTNRPKEIGEIGWDALVSGFEGAYHFVSGVVGDTLDKLNSGRPMEAGSYTGALAPISKMTYNKLSEEEKKKYVPPTNGEVIAFNIEAQRLADEELAKTGKTKRFVWTLLDSVGLGEERNYTIGHVIRVADGDTFTVMVGDEKKSNEKTVRMLLVDTPETVKPDTPEMPFGKDASNKTKKFLINKDVRLVFDKGGGTDKYGRILAYVEVDGVDYNKQLIEEGYGKYNYNYENYSRAPEYLEAERSANAGKKGIWQLDGYADLNYDSPYHLDYNLQQRYKKLLETMSK